jgi:hypothetical protein
MSDMSTAGENDRWILVERQSSDGSPLLVRTRIGNQEVNDFSKAHKVTAVICDILPALTRADGMPTCLDKLHLLEDEIVEAMARQGGRAFHTASVTGDGRRVLYLAHSSSLQIKDAIAKIVSDVCEIQVFDELKFETYSDFVTPTVIDMKLDGDRQVLTALEGHGDLADAPRAIEFFFYGERANLEEFLAEAHGRGFTLDHWIEEPSGVMVTRTMPAEFSDFRELTPYLVEAADRFGIDYDGWGTSIVAAPLQSEPMAAPKSPRLAQLFGFKKK